MQGPVLARVSIPPPRRAHSPVEAVPLFVRRAAAAAIDVGLLGVLLVVLLGVRSGFEGLTPRSAAAAVGFWPTLGGLALCCAVGALALVASGGRTPGRTLAGVWVARAGGVGVVSYGPAVLHEAIPRGLVLLLVVSPSLDRLAPVVPVIAVILALEALLGFTAQPGETVHERLAGTRAERTRLRVEPPRARRFVPASSARSGSARPAQRSRIGAGGR